MEDAVDRAAAALIVEVQAAIAQPFESAVRSVTAAKTRPEIVRISESLRMQFEAAVSRASSLIAQQAGLERLRLQRELYNSFGIEERLRSTAGGASALASEIDTTILLPGARPDNDSTLLGGVVGASAGGLVGGALLGGAGIALLATGPIGWLIGLGIGSLMGGGLAAVATRLATRDNLHDDDKQSMVSLVTSTHQQAQNRITRSVQEWSQTTKDELNSLHDAFFGSRLDEIARIDRILGDRAARQAELDRIDGLLSRVHAIAEQLD